VLRCGVRRPAGIAGAQLVIVNGVRWFRQPAAGGVTWTALLPAAYLALRIPTSDENQGSFLVDLAPPLKQTLR
jgi:hypothetical protein